MDNPKHSYDLLEDYSHHIKLYNYDFKQHDDFVDTTNRLREPFEAVKDIFGKQKKLLEVKPFIIANSSETKGRRKLRRRSRAN